MLGKCGACADCGIHRVRTWGWLGESFGIVEIWVQNVKNEVRVWAHCRRRCSKFAATFSCHF
jgi:hypothetical protein